MAQIKISKEELKHDEFIDTTDKVFLWLKQNYSVILVGLAAAFVIYGAVLFVQGRRTAAAIGASDLYGAAIVAYNAAVRDTAWGTGDRQAAMAEVIESLEQLQAGFAGTYLAREGLHLLGSAFFSIGDDMRAARGGAGIPNTEQAINAFTRFTAETDAGTHQRARGNLGLAYANENAFFLTDERSYLDNAILNFTAVVDNPGAGFLADEARLALARLRAHVLDDREGAIGLLRQVMENRWVPLEPVGEDATDQQRLRQMLDEQFQMLTLGASARIELLRLGVDVDAEFPQFRRAD